ncbi:MAG: hypothetical protein ABJZ55_04390 [Fuerstiella sp.]
MAIKISPAIPLVDGSSCIAFVAEQLGNQKQRMEFLQKDYRLSKAQLNTHDLRSLADFVSITTPRLAEALDDAGNTQAANKMYLDSLQLLENAGQQPSRKLFVSVQSLLASWSRASEKVKRSTHYIKANELMVKMAKSQITSLPGNLRNYEALALGRYNQIMQHEGASTPEFVLQCAEFRNAITNLQRRYKDGTFDESTSMPLSFILEKSSEVDQMERSVQVSR